MPSTQLVNAGIHSNWPLGENGWDTEMNANLTKLDAMLSPYMLSGATDIPGAPTAGDRYIIPAAATGAWTGQDNNIARYNGATWDIFPVIKNWIAFVEDAGIYVRYNGADWVTMLAGGGGGSSLSVTVAQTGTLTAFDVWLADVSAGVQTRALPASPSNNDEILIVDDEGNSAAFNITVGRNGKLIAGVAEDLVIDVNYTRVYLKYVTSLGSWQIILG